MDDLDALLSAKASQATGDPIDALLAARANPSPPPPAQRPQPEPLSWWDQQLAKVPTSLVNNPAVAASRNIVTGAAAPIMGGAQLIANMFPDSTGVPQLYNRKVAEMLRKDDEAAAENPTTATTNRFAGNMVSPANLAIGANVTPAVTAGARAVQGTTIGAAGGVTAPVDVGDSGKYWGKKGIQTAVSTVTGAALAPVIGYVGDKVLARINAKDFNPSNAAKEADDIISGALKESNQSLGDVPPDQLNNLRQQVVTSLSQGKRLDAAAALRKADFDAERVVHTQGQITRDPMQFADEQTMKAMSPTLSQTLALGNKQVMQGINQYGADAAEAPAASKAIADALRNYDATKRAAVTNAYAEGRAQSAGAPEIPMQGLAQDVVGFVDTLPDSVKKSLPLGAFEKYGLSGGKQTKAFSYDDAENLLQTLNASRNNDPATVRAIDKLNGFVKDAIGQGGSQGPFGAARSLAAQRFAEQDAIPALKAAADGDAGDNFVQKYIINGQTGDVQKLAGLLRNEAPDAYQQARQQIGAEFARKAFGENVAADKQIAQESYNRAVRNFGTDKLNAFYEPQEVDQIKRLGRLGAYQQSNPAAAATNFSNTAGALANLLRSGGGIPMAGKTIQTIGEKMGGYAATHPQVPVAANLSDEQRLALSRALTAITGGTAMALPARVVGQ